MKRIVPTVQYVVALEVRADDSAPWAREEFRVTASDKNNARTYAVEVAKSHGYQVGGCIRIEEV